MIIRFDKRGFHTNDYYAEAYYDNYKNLPELHLSSISLLNRFYLGFIEGDIDNIRLIIEDYNDKVHDYVLKRPFGHYPLIGATTVKRWIDYISNTSYAQPFEPEIDLEDIAKRNRAKILGSNRVILDLTSGNIIGVLPYANRFMAGVLSYSFGFSAWHEVLATIRRNMISDGKLNDILPGRLTDMLACLNWRPKDNIDTSNLSEAIVDYIINWVRDPDSREYIVDKVMDMASKYAVGYNIVKFLSGGAPGILTKPELDKIGYLAELFGVDDED